MDGICIDLKMLNISSHTLEGIIGSVLEVTCRKERCVSYESLFSEIEPWLLEKQISFQNVLGFFKKSVFSNPNSLCENSCIIIVYRVIFNCCKKAMGNKSLLVDFEKEDLLAVCNYCVTLPDEVFPLTSEFDGSTKEKVMKNTRMNLMMTQQCLLLYMDILFCEKEWFCRTKIPDLSINELTSLQKYIIRKSISKLWLIIASRLGDHSWSNDCLTKTCNDMSTCIRVLLNYSTFDSFFCGKNESETTSLSLFPNGIASVVLDDICKQFTKANWKKSDALKHALIWCVTKIKHPNLGVFISKIMPALFLMVDDYITTNKVLGICGINYVIRNVNPADLTLYNHADVIYDTLYKQLFSNDDQLYEVTLPCLYLILCVLESKAVIVAGVEFSRFDKAIEKILQNVDFTTRLSSRIILLKYLPDFINGIGGNVIKHLETILDIVIRCLEYGDGKDEMLRSHALDVCTCTIRNAWPVVSRYQIKIFKCLLKFMVDVNDSSFLGNNDTKENLERKVFHILVLMRICCKESFDMLIQEVTECSIDVRYRTVQLFLEKVLSCNLTAYNVM